MSVFISEATKCEYFKGGVLLYTHRVCDLHDLLWTGSISKKDILVWEVNRKYSTHIIVTEWATLHSHTLKSSVKPFLKSRGYCNIRGNTKSGMGIIGYNSQAFTNL